MLSQVLDNSTWKKSVTKVFFGLLVLGAALSITLLAGCTETSEDAGLNNRNTGPADIINMPDGFSNVASKCDGPNRVYTIYHSGNPYGAVAVVPNDPRCTSN